MAGELILNSLEIQRFRCFRELRIGRLGRVNLVVGKNNVGKSTILEALGLFARPSSIEVLVEFLASRNEVSHAEISTWRQNPDNPLPVDSLFFGRRGSQGEAILIGPSASSEEALEVTLREENQIWNFSYPEEAKTTGKPSQIFNFYHRIKLLVYRIGPSVRIFPVGIQMFHGLPAEPVMVRPSTLGNETSNPPIRDLPCFAVGPGGLEPWHIGRLWDMVSLSPLEEDVVTTLHIISPEIQRVAMKAPRAEIDGATLGGAATSRIPFVKIQRFEEPMPLRALGDGVNRLFGLALSMASAKGGLLLVDEIENGIHYSVQADLWRLVFETAARLNVQVFATTHSYDCIKAFEEAARESEEEGVLVRLARKDDRTLVGEFDERELEIAVEGDIEVR